MSLTKVPASMTLGGGAGGVTLAPLVATTLTISSASTTTDSAGNAGISYNGNTLPCANASAQAVTINSGAALTGGMVLEQTGAGLVSFVAGGGVTLNAPNGLSTSGPRTTLVLVQESTDVYTVLAKPTADSFIDLGTIGATVTLNMALYNAVKLTLSANLTISVTGAVSGQRFVVGVTAIQDASHTITISPAAKTPGAAAYVMTTGAGKRDEFMLKTDDGGTTVDLYIVGQDVR